MTENATFLAERLLAELDNETSRSLLSDCYIQGNKYYKAYHILKNSKDEINRYKLALCCFELNKLQEAERVLMPPQWSDLGSRKFGTNFQKKQEEVPNGSFGLYLLGKVFERNEKVNEAC